MQLHDRAVDRPHGAKALDAGRQCCAAAVGAVGQACLGLKVNPAGSNVGAGEGVAVEFDAALHQAHNVAREQAACTCVQAHAHHRGGLAGDVVDVANSTVKQRAEGDIGGRHRVGDGRAHQQFLGAAVFRDIARQVHSLHDYLVGGRADSQCESPWNSERPGACLAIELQPCLCDASGATDADAAARFGAVGDPIDQHGQQVGISCLEGAIEGRGAAGALLQHGCRSVGFNPVHRDLCGGAGRAEVARTVLLYHAHVVQPMA